MAYSQANLSALPLATLSGSWQSWVYRSADALATVYAAGYISNATEMGMAVDDMVFIVDTNLHTINIAQVLSITSGAADLSNGTAVDKTNS